MIIQMLCQNLVTKMRDQTSTTILGFLRFFQHFAREWQTAKSTNEGLFRLPLYHRRAAGFVLLHALVHRLSAWMAPHQGVHTPPALRREAIVVYSSG